MTTATKVRENRTAPERSLEQRKQALNKGNQIRSHRARLKQNLKAGDQQLHGVLDDPKCETMRLVDVLLALPKVGRVKANRTLRKARISPSKTIGGMTERQRNDLLACLPPSSLNGINGSHQGE